MEVGFGQVDITPQPGSVLLGQLGTHRSSSTERRDSSFHAVHRLTATALVVKSNLTSGAARTETHRHVRSTTVCLVVCDVFAISDEDANKARGL